MKFILHIIFLLYFINSAFAFDARFEWTDSNSTSMNVIGYKLYQTNISGSYNLNNPSAVILPPNTTYTLTNIPEGTYYWVLTAYNSSAESLPSNEVTNYQAPVITPPDNVTGFHIVQIIRNEEHPPSEEQQVILGNILNSDFPNVITDTWINTNTTNYSSDISLNTYTWPENTVANRIIIKADLSMIPQNSTIIDATLYLYMYQFRGSNPYQNSIHKIINHNPILTSCNWNTYNGSNSWTDGNNGGINDMAPEEDVLFTDANIGYKEWSVTNMVQDFVNNSSLNYGMMIDSDANAPKDDYRFFRSTDYSNPSQRPYITIKYIEN